MIPTTQHHAPPRAFTLIEMLVVIAIIAILMVTIVAIGSGVRAKAARSSTLATLHTLQGLMKDYLDAGNPEPQVPAPWPYSTSPIPSQYVQTNPASDVCNWVIALNSNPDIAKKLAALPSSTDADSSPPPLPPLNPAHKTILDAFGTPIRYVPAAGTKEGYFMSAGPDRNFSNVTPAPASPLRADEIFSTDPQ
jgi:prepilin-type N-terminal cleavage/methylation domain-containing protein